MASPHSGDLGPCTLVWGSTTLSPVFEAASVKIEETEVEIKNSVNGETATDIVTTGLKVTVEASISGYTFDDLDAIFANSTKVSTTGIKILNSVGYAKSAIKADLTIKPTINGVASVTAGTWTIVRNCVPKVGAEIVFDNGTQRVIMVTFTALAPAAGASIVDFGVVA